MAGEGAHQDAARSIFPQIVDYEAFDGEDRSLDDAIRALKKLARLNELAAHGLIYEDLMDDDDDLLLWELAVAISCAADTVAGKVSKPSKEHAPEPTAQGDELAGPRARRSLDKNSGGAQRPRPQQEES